MELNLTNEGIYNGEVRQFSMENFIGIFPNSINDDLGFKFIKWFNVMSEKHLTISSMKDSGMSNTARKDELIHIPSTSTLHGLESFPSEICEPLWNNISECLKIYMNEYNIETPVTSYNFKVHRVQPSGGYHKWHQEHSFHTPNRVLAWHLTLEAPKGGGETEFLHQSIRVKPKVGQLTIWPAGFTHKHRGNPPLEGQKTYITGWFEWIPEKITGFS